MTGVDDANNPRTPGPWTFSKTPPPIAHYVYARASDGSQIHLCHVYSKVDGPLIAAAPDLFDALEKMNVIMALIVATDPQYGVHASFVEAANAALKKARGGA